MFLEVQHFTSYNSKYTANVCIHTGTYTDTFTCIHMYFVLVNPMHLDRATATDRSRDQRVLLRSRSSTASGKKNGLPVCIGLLHYCYRSQKSPKWRAVHSTCKTAKNSHVPAWKATHMAIITLRSTFKYCHPEEGGDRSITVLPPWALKLLWTESDLSQACMWCGVLEVSAYFWRLSIQYRGRARFLHTSGKQSWDILGIQKVLERNKTDRGTHITRHWLTAQALICDGVPCKWLSCILHT